MQINHVVRIKLRAHGDWHSLQWRRSLSVSFCAVGFELFRQRPSAQPAIASEAENHWAQVRKWCKLAREVVAKRRIRNRHETRSRCLVNEHTFLLWKLAIVVYRIVPQLVENKPEVRRWTRDEWLGKCWMSPLRLGVGGGLLLTG